MTLEDTRIIECPWCHGERAFDCGPTGWESAPWGMDINDGSPLTSWIECGACNGTGEIEVHAPLIDFYELELIAFESA